MAVKQYENSFSVERGIHKGNFYLVSGGREEKEDPTKPGKPIPSEPKLHTALDAIIKPTKYRIVCKGNLLTIFTETPLNKGKITACQAVITSHKNQEKARVDLFTQ